ncbi:hypothetical protein AB0L80_07555 [Streptomyces sp. NPDC052069]|uniref:hypothetical protein n=1 Tax=Streptomyces sp. NPDC052069 TaxID=3154650 RepID=UPI0034305A38
MSPLFRKRTEPQPPASPTPPPQQDPNRFTLRYADNPEDVGRWLAQHGYRAVIAGALSVAHAGVTYARPGLPAEIAVLGETLVYDGFKVTVESES